MGILTLIIAILKILGIILLVILGLIILFLLTLLFCSIKIDFNAKFYEKYQILLKVTYLFGIINYNFNYENKKHILKIFGKNILDKKNKKSSKSSKKNAKNINNSNDNDLANNDNINLSNFEKNSNENIKNKNIKNKNNNIKKSKIKNNTTKNKKNYTLNYFFKYKKEIIKQIIKLTKNVIKAIKFKKIKINLNYGFDDPYTTGKICAIISIILPSFSEKIIKDINLIPNFQEKQLNGNTELKIKTNLFKILLPILIFISNKYIRKILFKKGE